MPKNMLCRMALGLTMLALLLVAPLGVQAASIGLAVDGSGSPSNYSSLEDALRDANSIYGGDEVTITLTGVARTDGGGETVSAGTIIINNTGSQISGIAANFGTINGGSAMVTVLGTNSGTITGSGDIYVGGNQGVITTSGSAWSGNFNEGTITAREITFPATSVTNNGGTLNGNVHNTGGPMTLSNSSVINGMLTAGGGDVAITSGLTTITGIKRGGAGASSYKAAHS